MLVYFHSEAEIKDFPFLLGFSVSFFSDPSRAFFQIGRMGTLTVYKHRSESGKWLGFTNMQVMNSKLSEQKTEKHALQMFNCGGGLKADENWMSA